jgi:methyltransferase-like protein
MTLLEIYNKKSQFATRKVGNEMVLVPLKNNIADMSEMFTLNEVACFIWESIDGRNTENVILTSVIEAFEIDLETAAADYDSFLESLSKMMA